MSIMDKIFGRSAVAPVQQMKQPGNFPQNPEIQTDPNNPSMPAEVKKDPSPMDQFSELFKLDPTKVPKAPEATFAGLDPAKIAEAAKSNDFRKLVTPDIQAALVKGGPEAVNAMVEVMNAMSQKSFGDSAVATTKLIEKAEKTQEERTRAMVEDMIKSHSRKETLNSSNPLFSNPAVKPMMDMLSGQVAAKYPELSSAEQAKMVQDYTLQFAQAANPEKKPPQGTDKAGNKTDWTDFFEEY